MFGFRLVQMVMFSKSVSVSGSLLRKALLAHRDPLFPCTIFFLGEEHEKAGESRTVPHVFPVGLFAQA